MITFTEKEIQDILNYLGELPAKYSLKLILLIQQKNIQNGESGQTNN